MLLILINSWLQRAYFASSTIATLVAAAFDLVQVVEPFVLVLAAAAALLLQQVLPDLAQALVVVVCAVATLVAVAVLVAAAALLLQQVLPAVAPAQDLPLVAVSVFATLVALAAEADLVHSFFDLVQVVFAASALAFAACGHCAFIVPNPMKENIKNNINSFFIIIII